MKKPFLIMIIMLLVALLVSCSTSTSNSSGNSVTKTVDVTEATKSEADKKDDSNHGAITVDNNNSNSGVKSATNTKPSFDTAGVSSKIEVNGEIYNSSYSNYLFLILTNDSDTDCNVSVSVDFYDESDKIVGTKSESVDAFAAGTSVVVDFSCEDSFSKYEYTVTAQELDHYKCVDQNLKCEVNTASDKAIISVTNNGDDVAQFVEYYALFYKNDQLVSYDSSFVGDDDLEIKAGATQKEEALCYEDFDSVTVYLHGTSK